jgi:hypothetical protein
MGGECRFVGTHSAIMTVGPDCCLQATDHMVVYTCTIHLPGSTSRIPPLTPIKAARKHRSWRRPVVAGVTSTLPDPSFAALNSD